MNDCLSICYTTFIYYLFAMKSSLICFLFRLPMLLSFRYKKLNPPAHNVQKVYPSKPSSNAKLASCDVKANWARAVVPEEAQASSRRGSELVRNSLTSWAREGRDDGGRARSDGLDTEVGLDRSLRGIGSRFGSNVAELSEINLSIAREIVR